MSKDAEPKLIRLAEYQPPTHWIDSTELHFDIRDGETCVHTRLQTRRNPENPSANLRLDGQELALLRVKVDGRELAGNEYQRDDDSLTLFDLPDGAEVEIETRIHPEQNTALEGLYKSGGLYCTQCEAEGFRKITYYLDRPDVLATFRTTIVADGERFPVLLSNGNLIEEEKLADGRLQRTWEDPFPKPSYLFALVAGDLSVLEDSFQTRSGRAVDLRIYSEPHNIAQCKFAMDALKRSMRWDEVVFGREYDLDIFMIVAVEDFNMGAMENKGLNIFNTSCVLATPDTATDLAHQHVEAVVAHEYFHNWSGNRVTCRDWFQLSLKEGFTVYRDAEFSSDMGSRTVKRIADVVGLRTFQFAEDAGPLAHPVRPDSYYEISNFYTRTVYEKGAEVVRMLATLLGPDRFRRGTDLYFERHDGQAVTTEDFVRALEDANDMDLAQFRHWYSQAGTPRVAVEASFEGDRLQLNLHQRCPATPGQPEKAPFHIPLAFGLLDDDGRDMLGAAGQANGYTLETEASAEIENPGGDGTLILHLKSPESQLTVKGLSRRPHLSLLRGFSAPVRLETARDAEELSFLALHDSDGFSRWDAMNSLQQQVLATLRTAPDRAARTLADHQVRYAHLLSLALDAADDGEEKAMLEAMLSLPEEAYLYEQADEIDVDGLHLARRQLAGHLGSNLHAQWLAVYQDNLPQGAYQPDGVQIARRALKNLALRFLIAGAVDGSGQSQQRDTVVALLRQQLGAADNLTDRLAALSGMIEGGAYDLLPADEVQGALDDFLQRWRDERLVVDRWFQLQAAAAVPGQIDKVRELIAHPDFELRNPNRVRAVYAAFANQNLINFHAIDGSGYRLLADCVAQLDQSNPQIAARLLTPLTRWQRFDPERRQQMIAVLRDIAARPSLSPDVFEVITKSLADAV